MPKLVTFAVIVPPAATVPVVSVPMTDAVMPATVSVHDTFVVLPSQPAGTVSVRDFAPDRMFVKGTVAVPPLVVTGKLAGTPAPVPAKLNVPLPPTVFFTRIRVDSKPFTLPAWCSLVAGAGLPSESVPWPSADQALAPGVAVKVQAKSCAAPAASVM